MAKIKKKAKKTVKKKIVRKKAVKKRKVSKPAKPKTEVYVKIQSKILGESPTEFEFYVKDGKKLKNMYELVDALEHMNDDIFREHVNEFKNDFSNWVRDVFDEPKFAKEMTKVHDRIETQRVLMRKLIDEAKKVAKGRK